MWKCSRDHKNANSNKRCHASGCNDAKPPLTKKQEKILRSRVIRDYCPNCGRHHTFTKHGAHWNCSGCHRKFIKTGKPVPEPQRSLVVVGSPEQDLGNDGNTHDAKS